MGMQVSTINSQLCVQLDTGSMFSTYESHIDNFNLTQISNLKLPSDLSQRLLQDPTRGASSGLANEFSLGDGILALKNGAVINFPMPRAALDGTCQSKNGASFSLNEDSESCVQTFTVLQNACSGVLNAADLLSPLVYKGSNVSGSSATSINIRNFYVYAMATGSLSSPTNTLQASSFDPLTCSCANFVRSVDYTLYYTPQLDSSYTIDNILADVVVYDNVTFDPSYCNGNALIPVEVTQTYNL